MPDVMKGILMALLLTAAWSDLRTRRIPNTITVSCAVAGFALNAWFFGLSGMMASVFGAAAGLGLFMVLYVACGMGAGDVKLFSAAGAFLGPQPLLLAFVFTGVLGGVAALVFAAMKGRLRQTFFQTGRILAGGPAPSAADALKLPYGVVITAGVFLVLMTIH